MKKVVILDLDNTIYPVSSIADHLFNSVFDLINKFEAVLGKEITEKVKEDLKRIPYQKVAEKYGFSESMKMQGMHLLQNLEYEFAMQPFDDYRYISDTKADKYLVTTGFTKLQWSKVRQLNIESHFNGIYIVDPQLSTETKKDIFLKIIEANNYDIKDVLIIGDDPESEIQAARELGIDTFLYDPENRHPDARVTHYSKNLKDAATLIG